MIQPVKLMEKMQGILAEYQALRYRPVARYPRALRADTAAKHYRAEPEDLPFAEASAGDIWGKSGITTWFVLDVDSPQPDTFISLDYTTTDTGRNEQVLVFEDGAPIGVLDRNHSHVRLRGVGRLRIALEAYPFHTVPGNQPHERGRFVGEGTRVFQGVTLWQARDAVERFVLDARVLLDLYTMLDENDLMRYEILTAMQDVFTLVDAIPSEVDEARLHQQAERACERLAPLLAARNGGIAPSVALTAHAHIDTAWQWDLDETDRKCARTFSSVLGLMRAYPDFTFIQSQPYQLERMREYPVLYAEILERIAEGRWEINGGMYIEPDLNLPSGEALVRQLLYGQLTTREAYGKVSDTLWMPDTFGFTAALPQLMQGAGVRYFSTGKLRGNDTTRFPYDVFRWRGIDGTEVLAHFSRIENTPGPKQTIDQWRDVLHKDRQHTILNAFGYGDGGGGPTADMLEQARRTADLQGCPRGYFTTVSAYMQSVRQEGLPAYQGELYFQMHRGTYTSISEIKRLNRRLEFRFREAEHFLTLAALRGRPYPREALDALWKRFLVCQFHDILPGTAIESVNEWATQTMLDIHAHLGALMDLPAPGDTITLHNYVGTPSCGILRISANSGYPTGEGVTAQAYTDLDGAACVALMGVSIPAMGSRTLPLAAGKPAPGTSPFHWADGRLITPHLTAAFAPDGSISSLAAADGTQLARGRLNQFLLGEDVPAAWDNWDIDSDQHRKMAASATLVRRDVVSDGPVELRIRSEYSLGGHSTLWQDMVFHADSPQIDFFTKIDWHGKRTLLKAAFDTTIQSPGAQHEIQFGHFERPTHANEPSDRARFEVCCHKWTNLSQADWSVALLNDSKYGISVSGGSMALTLIKSSTHPDTRGDEGIHTFAYALLPYEGGFDALSVLPAANMLNAPVAISGLPERKPLIRVDNPAIVVEAVKLAQAEDAIVVRLYEAAGGNAAGRMTVHHPLLAAYEANLLEERTATLDAMDLRISLRPFEVKTILLVPDRARA